MAEDKNKTNERNRSKVAGDLEYEVGHLASRHSLTLDQARALVENHGNNRDDLDAAAERLKVRMIAKGSIAQCERQKRNKIN